MMAVRMNVVRIDKKQGQQIVFGMGNFSIKMVDDVYRACLDAVPGIKVGVAINEAAPKLTRYTCNDEVLGLAAARNLVRIGAGHAFLVLIENAFPINILNEIKKVAGTCTIMAASANEMEVIVGETDLGRAVLGVVDGNCVNRIETETERVERRELVKKLGYTLG
jgi:adenosine/AMP kinase